MMKMLTVVALLIAAPAFAQSSSGGLIKEPVPTDAGHLVEPPLDSLKFTIMPTPEAAAEDAVRKQMIGCTRSLRYVPDVFAAGVCAEAKKKWDAIVKQNEARGQK